MGWIVFIVVLLVLGVLSVALPLWASIVLAVAGVVSWRSLPKDENVTTTRRIWAAVAALAFFAGGGSAVFNVLASVSGGCGIEVARSGPYRDC